MRQFVGLALEWDLRLSLAAAEVPPARLRSRGALGGKPDTRLGLSTWLGAGNREPSSRDRDDLVLDPEAVLRAARACT